MIGISSYTYPWAVGVPGYPLENVLTPLDLVQKTIDLEIGLLQIADNCPLHELSNKEIVQISQKAANFGIILELGTRGIEPSHLMKYLKIAQMTGSHLIRTLLHSSTTQPDINQAIAWIKEVEPEFNREGVILAIENHDKVTTQELIQLVEAIESPVVGICLDTVNSLGALETPKYVVERLAPYTVNIHLKDFEIFRVSYQMGFIVEGRPLGSGRLDIQWTLEKIKKAGKKPTSVIEHWVPFQENLTKTIELEEDWAKKSIRYAKQNL